MKKVRILLAVLLILSVLLGAFSMSGFAVDAEEEEQSELSGFQELIEEDEDSFSEEAPVLSEAPSSPVEEAEASENNPTFSDSEDALFPAELQAGLSLQELTDGQSADPQAMRLPDAVKGNAASGTVYFAVPTDWPAYDTIIFNVRYQGESYNDNWHKMAMSPTSYTNEAGWPIYQASYDGEFCPYGGFAAVQFFSRNNGDFSKEWWAIPYSGSGSNCTSWTESSALNNKVFDNGNWVSFDNYQPASSTMDVYYDATFSKLPVWSEDVNGGGVYGEGGTYSPEVAGRMSIPAFGENNPVYYCAYGSTWTRGGSMVKAESGNYHDVYKASIPSDAQYVAFASYPLNGQPSSTGHGENTTKLSIPTGFTNPCFYGDTHDPVIYWGGYRDGYWGEAYTLRNAEIGKNQSIVDVSGASLNKDRSTYYAKATFYDYYSDFELNGRNRDYYPSFTDHNRYREWLEFRQFDQALSTRYETNNVSIPLYTGHFQPDWVSNGVQWGYPYSVLWPSLSLYGYNVEDQRPFMSTNNSTMDIYANGGKYDYATQGLVSDALSGGNIMAKGGRIILPHFDRDFLEGNNCKNAVLGKVYDNVVFPFTQQDLHNNGVKYWAFDSADTTLAIRWDNNLRAGGWWLEDVGNQGWSKNVNSSGTTAGNPVSTTYGFFPFDDGSTEAYGPTYNYGFGMKLEISFHLTEDGRVEANDGTRVPIELEFSGDDDLWIFIDGKLALDLGGSHGRVTGKLNFADLTATVSKVKAGQGSETAGENVTSSFAIDGRKTDRHTMDVFYMERGQFESNLRLNFNFPDENLFSLEKQVDTQDVNTTLFPDTLFSNLDFPFQIKNLVTHYGTRNEDPPHVGFRAQQDQIRDYGSSASGALENVTDAAYTVGTAEIQRVGSDGKLNLKRDQVAVFRDQFRRGSYISVNELLEGQMGVLFTPSWTVYGADGLPITSFAVGSSVENGSVSSLVNQPGTNPDDDRSETIFLDGEGPENSFMSKYQQDETPYHPDGSLLFRSYSKPDETIGETVLKASFTNKVNVGSLSITKDRAYSTDDLTGSYSFTVTFTDIGGLDLNNGTPISESFALAYGETKTITGIPVGTRFTVEETAASDGASVEKILVDNEEVTQATGIISTKDQTVSVVIQNTLKPLVNATVIKLWTDENDAALDEDLVPASINVQLQRSSDGSTWTAVPGYENVVVEKAAYANGHKIERLDRYVDHTVAAPVAWQYRFVELDSSGNALTGDIVELGGNRFAVSTQTETSTPEGSDTELTTTTITNKYSPLPVDLRIEKAVSGNIGNKTHPFTFSLVLTDRKDQVLSQKTFTCEGVLTSVTTGTDGSISFSLANGDYLLIKDLPYGVKFTLEETDEAAVDYTTTITAPDGTESVAKTVSGSLSAAGVVAVDNSLQIAVPTGLAPLSSFAWLFMLPLLLLLSWKAGKRVLR